MKKKVLELPYIGYEDIGNYTLLYGEKGNPIVIFKIANPVLELAADIDVYVEAQEVFMKIVKTLSDGMLIQKTDIVQKKPYEPKEEKDKLLETYQQHFKGRVYKSLNTYFTITTSFIESRKKIAKYSKKEEKEFFNKIDKVFQIMQDANMKPEVMRQKEIDVLLRRLLTFNFDEDKPLYAENIKADDSHITIGKKFLKSITIVDTEKMGVPSLISPVEIKGGEDLEKDITAYPVDNMKVIFDNDDYTTLLYNQVIEICQQTKTVAELEVKKKRSISVKDPSNTLGAEDIDAILNDIARNSQLLVRAHFNLLIGCDSEELLSRSVNFFESAYFSKGFLTGRNSVNQMELFRTCLLGNANELKHYDMFLTSADSAVCFFFKESRLKDELSDYYLYFTDRQGIPLRIDPDDVPMRQGRISNRNKFVLGPSGSGKSFWMNAYVSQILRYNMDVVIIDTGNSYIGLCDYYGGKYITYQEDKPITMNPFKITKEEKNLEKIEFLTNLILLIFKDNGEKVTKDEQDIVAEVLEEYYKRYFDWDENWYAYKTNEELIKYLNEKGKDTRSFKFDTDIKSRIQSSKIMSYYNLLGLDENCEIEDLKRTYRHLAKQHHPDVQFHHDDGVFKELNVAYNELLKIKEQVEEDNTDREELIEYVKRVDESLKVEELSFNSFYDFACNHIPMILKSSKLSSFNYDKFKYVLKKFYRGGRFETILNEEADRNLLEERFIVFEIDNVKDNPTLFPIVTLVIMDVFLQKMRLRGTHRKALIIEEAWKAIASELMGGYILYLYKTVRKFWGQCIVVTQELNDIIDNPVVKDSIISNSDSLILLEQTKFKDNYDKVANLLSLNSVEQSKIFTVNQMDNKKNRNPFKEFYFKRGSVGEVYGNEVSMFQYLAFTTEKPEKNAIGVYKNIYNNYNDAILNFISDMEHVKISMPKYVQIVNYLNKIPDQETKTFIKKNRKSTMLLELLNSFSESLAT